MKILELLKARWPEVMMVAGLQACCVALLKDMQGIPQAQVSIERMFFLGLGTAIFGILSQMVFWGFLRTAAVGCMQPVEPTALLKTGRVYFWRMLLFQLLLLPVFLLVASVPQIAVQKLVYGKVTAEPPLWLGVIAATAAGLILMKPIYLVPAMILRRNCGIWDALRNLRQVRLSEMGRFVIITASILAVSGAVEYMSGLVGRRDMLYYPALASQAIVSSSGAVAVFLMAVMEVARRVPMESENKPNEGEIK
jgi:uncharacterized integral membrane protein